MATSSLRTSWPPEITSNSPATPLSPSATRARRNAIATCTTLQKTPQHRSKQPATSGPWGKPWLKLLLSKPPLCLSTTTSIPQSPNRFRSPSRKLLDARFAVIPRSAGPVPRSLPASARKLFRLLLLLQFLLPCRLQPTNRSPLPSQQVPPQARHRPCKHLPPYSLSRSTFLFRASPPFPFPGCR